MIIKGTVDCIPEEADYDPGRIDVLNGHFLRMIEKKEIEGAAYCISRRGKIIASHSMGTAHYYDGPGDMRPDTIHGIASITKTFTAVAVMKLAEDGLTRLDMSVGDILPQFAAAPFDKITLFQLLTHTSGLQPDGGCFPEEDSLSPWEYIEEAEKNRRAGEKSDWLTMALSCGMRREPGKEWQYCSFGFAVLGAVIEKLSGMKAEKYIEESILKPLDLQDTFFLPAAADKVKRINLLAEEEKEEIDRAADNVKREPSVWEQIPHTGGGLFSTPCDLIRFANMMLGMGTWNGVRILGRRTVEKMTASSLFQVPDYCWGANEPDRKYAIGFDRREGPGFHYSKGTYMHEGSGSCSLVIDPQEQLAAAWFVPFRPGEWYAEGLWNVSNIIWSGL